MQIKVVVTLLFQLLQVEKMVTIIIVRATASQGNQVLVICFYLTKIGSPERGAKEEAEQVLVVEEAIIIVRSPRWPHM